MTGGFVAGLAIVAGVGLIWLLAVVGPYLILRMHDATEARVDQAPHAFGLLDELAAAARVARPRLYVLPASHPNGFAVANGHDKAVAVTEGVFERLDRDQLRGLLALLVARVTRPMARAETAIAALALVLSPLVLPSMALAHFGLPGRRWFEVDRSAVQLVGREPVVAALEGLESARDGRGGVPASAASALYCVRPGVLTDALATQPTTRDRIDRLDGLGVAADARPSARQARSEK